MVGLITRLVRVMRGTNVQRYVGISRDMVTHMCWHLAARLHGGGTDDEDKRSTIMDQDDILWRTYREGAYLGMVSLVAVGH